MINLRWLENSDHLVATLAGVVEAHFGGCRTGRIAGSTGAQPDLICICRVDVALRCTPPVVFAVFIPGLAPGRVRPLRRSIAGATSAAQNRVGAQPASATHSRRPGKPNPLTPGTALGPPPSFRFGAPESPAGDSGRAPQHVINHDPRGELRNEPAPPVATEAVVVFPLTSHRELVVHRLNRVSRSTQQKCIAPVPKARPMRLG
jgi:hypothetical protein